MREKIEASQRGSEKEGTEGRWQENQVVSLVVEYNGASVCNKPEIERVAKGRQGLT